MFLFLIFFEVHKHCISPSFSASDITGFPPLPSSIYSSGQNLFWAHFHLRDIPKSPFTGEAQRNYLQNYYHSAILAGFP